MSSVEFFKQAGLDVVVEKNIQGTHNVSINLGVLQTPNIHELSKLIKDTFLNYAPVRSVMDQDKIDQKEIEDYRTFFRLLRGGK